MIWKCFIDFVLVFFLSIFFSRFAWDSKVIVIWLSSKYFHSVFYAENMKCCTRPQIIPKLSATFCWRMVLLKQRGRKYPKWQGHTIRLDLSLTFSKIGKFCEILLPWEKKSYIKESHKYLFLLESGKITCQLLFLLFSRYCVTYRSHCLVFPLCLLLT